MVFRNSENALAIVSDAISMKTSVALEAFSVMKDTRRGCDGTLTLEAVSGVQGFSAKLNDVYATLQNIDIDEPEVISALKEIGRIPKDLRDSSISYINPNNVGRVNASYIRDFADDIASTAERILRGEIRSIASTNVSTVSIEGIKSQIAQGSYKGNTARACSMELPKSVSYTYDGSFASATAIPFVKTFSAKRLEIGDEIATLDRAAEAAFSTVRSVAESKSVLSADTEARQLLNVYLSAAGSALIDITSFTAYLIIRKMDIMIANATAINAMCENIRRSGTMQALAIEAVSIVASPEYRLENADVLIGTVNGIYGKIKYNLSNFYGNTARPVTDDIIAAIQDQYAQMIYPAEVFVNILNQKKEALKKFKAAICTQEFPTPIQLATDLGLCGSVAINYADKIKEITDISAYANNASAGSADKAFAALAELKDTIEIIRKIRDNGNEIAAFLDDLKILSNNQGAMVSKSETVRKELYDVTKKIAFAINGEVIPQVFTAIDKRCVALDGYISSILLNTTAMIPDMADLEEDTDYLESAVQSDLRDKEDAADALIMEAANAFYAEKTRPVTFLATEAESPATTPGGGTPGNPIAAVPTAGNGDKPESNKSVEVKEDPTKQSDADSTQNEDAANAKKKDPAAFKDSMKKLMDQAMKFFDDMIQNFTKTINAKKSTDAAAYITANKDAILNRSFNGITLKIPYFPELVTTSVVKEINQVGAAVGALNVQSINSSTEDKLATLLFPFADFGTASTADERIKAVKERYTGQDGQQKEEFKGAKLRTKTQEMIAFCEEYYVNKKCNDVATALQSLKDTTKGLLNGLSTITDAAALPEDAKIKFVNRSVKMFAGAIATTYRNQANAYYSALRSLTPKKKVVAQVSDVQPGDEQLPTTSAEGHATPTVPATPTA